jgi:uncharacterized protein
MGEAKPVLPGQLVMAAFLFVTMMLPGLALGGELIIGTGGVQGVYHPVGKAISKIVNSGGGGQGFTMKAVSTKGSVANIEGLAGGSMHFGLAQADTAHDACTGEEHWKKLGKQKKLRTVLPLYCEGVTCLASVESGIRKCRNFRGKVVALGAVGSGTRQNALDALKSCGLKPADLAQMVDANAAEAAQLLQQGSIDAFFYTVAHPNRLVKKATQGPRPTHFVSFPNYRWFHKHKYPYYQQYFLWLDKYPKARNRGSKVHTFGVKTFLMSSADVPEDVVYTVLAKLFDNYESLKKAHRVLLFGKNPFYSDLKWSLSAPYHPGALRFFKEEGITHE